jgi:hypothetical protein
MLFGLMFKSVAIYTASERAADMVGNFGKQEKQMKLLAASDEPVILKLKKKHVEIMVGPAMIGVIVGDGKNNVARQALIHIDDVAPREWADYVNQHYEYLASKTARDRVDFLGSAFSMADSYRVRPDSLALAVVIGQALQRETGIIIGNGPSDPSSILIFEHLARAALVQQKDVVQLLNTAEAKYNRVVTPPGRADSRFDTDAAASPAPAV